MRYGLPTRITHRNETPAMKMLLNCTEKRLEELCTPPMQTMDAVISTANGELYRYTIPRPELEDGAACDEIRLRVQNGFPQIPMTRPTYHIEDVTSQAATDFDEAATSDEDETTTEPLRGTTSRIIHFTPPVETNERASGSGEAISEYEVSKVLEMREAGVKPRDIMRGLWDTPDGGSMYQRDSVRLSRIDSEIARRYRQQVGG